MEQLNLDPLPAPMLVAPSVRSHPPATRTTRNEYHTIHSAGFSMAQVVLDFERHRLLQLLQGQEAEQDYLVKKWMSLLKRRDRQLRSDLCQENGVAMAVEIQALRAICGEVRNLATCPTSLMVEFRSVIDDLMHLCPMVLEHLMGSHDCAERGLSPMFSSESDSASPQCSWVENEYNGDVSPLHPVKDNQSTSLTPPDPRQSSALEELLLDRDTGGRRSSCFVLVSAMPDPECSPITSPDSPANTPKTIPEYQTNHLNPDNLTTKLNTEPLNSYPQELAANSDYPTALSNDSIIGSYKRLPPHAEDNFSSPLEIEVADSQDAQAVLQSLRLSPHYLGPLRCHKEWRVIFERNKRLSHSRSPQKRGRRRGTRQVIVEEKICPANLPLNGQDCSCTLQFDEPHLTDTPKESPSKRWCQSNPNDDDFVTQTLLASTKNFGQPSVYVSRLAPVCDQV